MAQSTNYLISEKNQSMEKTQDWKTIREVFIEIGIFLSHSQCWKLGTIIAPLVDELRPNLKPKKRDNIRVYPSWDQELMALIVLIGKAFLNLK